MYFIMKYLNNNILKNKAQNYYKISVLLIFRSSKIDKPWIYINYQETRGGANYDYRR